MTNTANNITAEALANAHNIPALEAALSKFQTMATAAAIHNDPAGARLFYDYVNTITEALTLKGAPPANNAIAAVLT